MDFFQTISEAITPILDDSFPAPIRIISEPGRYFCTATTTMAVQITAKREYVGAPQVSPLLFPPEFKIFFLPTFWF